MSDIAIKIAAEDLTGQGVQSARANLESLESAAKSVVSAFAGIMGGAAALLELKSAITSSITSTEQLAGETFKLSQMTGMTSEAASGLIAVAEHVGIIYDVVQSALTALSRRMGGLIEVEDAMASTSGASANVFDRLGITVKNTDGTMKSISDVFSQVRTSIQGMSQQSDQLAAATQLFRGNAAQLLPLLTMSDDQYKELADNAKKYGVVLSGDNVSAIREYTFAHREMDQALQGLKLALGQEILPAIIEYAKTLTDSVSAVRTFVAEHEIMVSAIKTGVSGIAEAAVALGGIWAVSKFAGWGLTAASSLLTGLQMAFTAEAVTAVLSPAFIVGIAALAGYAAYSFARYFSPDQLALRNATKDLSDQITYSAAQGSDQLAKLGFTGASAMKEFNSAVQAHKLVWDAASASWKAAPQTLKVTQDQIDATTKGFAELGTMIEKMGNVTLKMGSDNLHDEVNQHIYDMRALTVQYQQLSDTVKAGLTLDTEIAQIGRITSAYDQYGQTIEAVYDRQYTAEETVLAAMMSYGAAQKDIEKQAANVIQSEIKGNEALLANERGKYAELEKMESTYYKAVETSAKNIVALQKSMSADIKSANDAIWNIWDKANPAQNDADAYGRKMAKIYRDMDDAGQLSGKDQISALQNVIKEIEALPSTVTISDTLRTLVDSTGTLGLNTASTYQDTVVQTVIDKSPDAISLVSQLRDRIIDLNQNAINQEAANGAKAQAALDNVRSQIDVVTAAIQATESAIVSLDNALSETRTLTIKTDGALSQLTQVREVLTSIFNLTGGSGQSGGSSLSPGTNMDGSPQVTYSQDEGNAAGIPYVPRTALYKLHAGEGVLTAEQNSSLRQGVTFTFAPGSITVNGANKSTDDIVAEIVPAIRARFIQIDAIK